MKNITEQEIALLKQMQNDPSSKCNIKRMLKKRKPDLLKRIIESTSFLKENATIGERLYCIFNNLTSIPLCAKCHKNQVRFSPQGNYSTYCSLSCAISVQMKEQWKDHINTEKARQTRMERYGAFHPSDFVDKLKATNLKKHGCENYANVDLIRQTKQERYGNPNYVNREKRMKTNEERYGNPYYNNGKQISETKQLFSDEKNDEINQKRKETNLERYGVEYATQNPNVKEQTRNTTLKKYGIESTLKLPNVRQSMRLKSRTDAYETMISKIDEYEPMFTKEEFLSVDNLRTFYFQWKHKPCGEIVEGRYSEGKIIAHCRKCYPYSSSIHEKQLVEYIQNVYDGEIIENDRHIIHPKEIDIYIPERKLGIEFDGLYWHSESVGTLRGEMLEKTIKCKNADIRLIHVFEDEWIHKQEIVKSRIANLLGVSNRIYARKCVIKEVSFNDTTKFLTENHIQGPCPSGIRLGMYFNEELVSLMSFGKSRFSKKYEWELLRFCNKNGYTVIGGASKLLKYFERTYKPKSLVSYADRRWSDGGLYYNLGFEKISDGSPNYWYFSNSNGIIRESRIKYQKHKLPKLLETFDPNKSEVENMRMNGYHRIFDCGNYAFVKTYSDK